MIGRDMIDFIVGYELEDRQPDEIKASDGIVIFYGKYSFDFDRWVVAWDEYKLDWLGDGSERREVSLDDMCWGDDMLDKVRAFRDGGSSYEEMAEYLAPNEWEYWGDSKLIA